LSIARTPGNDHRAASRARRRAIVLPRASQIAYFGAIALMFSVAQAIQVGRRRFVTHCQSLGRMGVPFPHFICLIDPVQYLILSPGNTFRLKERLKQVPVSGHYFLVINQIKVGFQSVLCPLATSSLMTLVSNLCWNLI
jgi:hypothetical protein